MAHLLSKNLKNEKGNFLDNFCLDNCSCVKTSNVTAAQNYAVWITLRTRGGFFKHKSRAILELISSYSPTFQNEFLKKSWRFQNPELENNSRTTQNFNYLSTAYSLNYCDYETHWLISTH